MERKADMFTKRTISPHRAVDHVDTASEALAVSIAEKAKVDMPYMAQLSGTAKEKFCTLGSAGMVTRSCSAPSSSSDGSASRYWPCMYLTASRSWSDSSRPSMGSSRYTMDAKSEDTRKYLAERADLLGAIRLPNNAFRANAGTDVVTDILFFQKRDTPQVELPDWVHVGKNENGCSGN